jgi:hypothetical protein
MRYTNSSNGTEDRALQNGFDSAGSVRFTYVFIAYYVVTEYYVVIAYFYSVLLPGSLPVADAVKGARNHC